MTSKPLYPIGIVAEIVGVRPETLRVWDREGLVTPERWRGFRCYSDADLQRLFFVKHLLNDEGFNMAGARAYLRLYHCWSTGDCASAHKATIDNGKPCWKWPDAYCGLMDEESSACKACAQRSIGTSGASLPLREKPWRLTGLQDGWPSEHTQT